MDIIREEASAAAAAAATEEPPAKGEKEKNPASSYQPYRYLQQRTLLQVPAPPQPQPPPPPRPVPSTADRLMTPAPLELLTIRHPIPRPQIVQQQQLEQQQKRQQPRQTVLQLRTEPHRKCRVVRTLPSGVQVIKPASPPSYTFFSIASTTTTTTTTTTAAAAAETTTRQLPPPLVSNLPPSSSSSSSSSSNLPPAYPTTTTTTAAASSTMTQRLNDNHDRLRTATLHIMNISGEIHRAAASSDGSSSSAAATAIKELRTELADLNSQVIQSSLMLLIKAEKLRNICRTKLN